MLCTDVSVLKVLRKLRCVCTYILSTQNKYSKSSDIWALGIILYELACQGNHPFPAEDIDELKRKILNDEI